MGQRLAAAGELAGLTEPEIMALAAAMSSVGIEAEAGGTAMTQTLTAMEKAVATGGDRLEKFASVAGMSAEQFASTWESKPIEAIDAFISGLGRLDEQGESATLVLDEMGLSGVRQGNMLKSLATASGLLSDTVALANKAWVENIALMQEAQTRYATTESKLAMLKNSTNNLKIAIGDQLTPALNSAITSGKNLVDWATDFTEENEWLAPAILAVSSAMAVMLGAMGTATVVIPLLTKAVAALNASFLANPYALVATALVSVTAALVTFAAASQGASKEATVLKDAMSKCVETFDDAGATFENSTKNIEATSKVANRYIDRLAELEKKTELTKQEQFEYNTLVGQLSQIMPDANTSIDENTGFLETGAEALRSNVEGWKEMALAAAEAAQINAMSQSLTEAYVALSTAQMEVTEMQESMSAGAWKYYAALEAEKEALANFNAVQTDSSSSYADIQSAEAALNEAQRNRLSAGLAVTEQDRNQAKALAELEEEIPKAEEQIALYEERMKKLSESTSQTAEATSEMAEGMSEAGESAEKMQEAASRGIAEGFAESFSGVPETAQTAMSETEAVVTAGKETITANVTDMGTQSATGFDTEFSNIKDSANKSLSDTITTVNGYSSQAYSAGYGIGAAISQGASAGVMAYAAQVAAAAAQMVRNAITAANQAAQINSPSKLTRKTGQGLDEGMIYGIRDLEDEVIKQMEDTMGKVTAVEVKTPEIPDMPDPVFRAMDSRADGHLMDVLNNVSKERPNVTVNVTQYIYAEDTSYAGQQREAKRKMKEIAREISR